MDPNRQYLASKINPILEPLVADLLLQKPADPAEFIITWMHQKYGKSVPTKDAPTKDAPKKPEAEKDKPKKKGEAKPKGEKGSENESSEEEDDEIEGPPMKKIESVSRKAISAEAYGDWNKKSDFVARVIEKTPDQKKRIHAKLQTSFIFNALEAKEMEIVILAMEEKHYEPGAVVIQQGDEGDGLYVVETGALSCYRRFQKDQEPKFLKEYAPGEAFGELALLYNAPRAATITAKTPCILWCLDRATFNNIVKDAAIKKREKYEDFLKGVKIFSTIEPYELTKIMDAVKPVEYKAGSFIIKEGEEGNEFFLLESGEAFATKVLEAGKEATKTLDYAKSSYFGELALLKGAPRAANVIAKTDCVCLTLDRHSFKRLLGPLDEILKRNSEVYAQFIAKK